MAAGRKEDVKQATVYLCNNGIRFTKVLYPSCSFVIFAFTTILKKFFVETLYNIYIYIYIYNIYIYIYIIYIYIYIYIYFFFFFFFFFC